MKKYPSDIVDEYKIFDLILILMQISNQIELTTRTMNELCDIINEVIK
jgi:hypothetical protein